MEQILSSINEYLDFFNKTEVGAYIFLGFLLTFTIVIVFRIIISGYYRVQQALISVNAKPIVSRELIKDTHSGMLNDIIKDYTRLGEKGVTLYSSRNIVEKHVSKISFFVISCQALEGFVDSMEQSEIFVGMVLTIVFEEYRLPFLVGTLTVFLIMRILSVFFNFKLLRGRLVQNITEYVDSEIGRFFIGDMSATLTKFRNEVSNSLHQQTEGMAASVKKMGDNIAGVMKLGLQEISKTVDTSMEGLKESVKEINESLSNWRELLELSEKSQTSINEATEKLNTAAAGYMDSHMKMTDIFDKFLGDVKEGFGLMRNQLDELKINAQALQKFNEPVAVINKALQSQLEYIEKNQAMLEASTQKYELSLQELTAKMGEGLGSMLDYHIKSSYNSLNERLEENIKQTVGSNNALLQRLQQLFEETRQLSRSETQAIIKIKEQMDLHFDNLSEKMTNVQMNMQKE